MPSRPAPLKTSGHTLAKTAPFSPLPSELPRTPIHSHFDTLKSHEEAMKTPITPPSAYTEFLKNTVNSPALTSPRPSISVPYSPAPTSRSSSHLAPPTPMSATACPPATKRTRLPPTPRSVTSSPDSARSPASDDGESEHNSTASAGRVTVKQIVKTTVRYTPHMSLMPAPKGKRRRLE